MTEDISKDELKAKIDGGEDFQLVDVRGKECCYDNGHIPGAISMPLNELEERAPRELDRDKLVVVYCGSYTCTLSPRAAHMLKHHLGFKKVLDYSGGIKEWQESGLPVEK
ncbi:MAG: rhodanese-like domain-containing protein [Methanobacteriota archaeon]|nr:MAG: rhodanese-like domain-containing protein [Euryarchaeota archaeon]